MNVSNGHAELKPQRSCRPNPRRAEASEEEGRAAASAMKFMKLGSKPDAFQTDGSDAR